jgi:hypothetical protein
MTRAEKIEEATRALVSALEGIKFTDGPEWTTDLLELARRTTAHPLEKFNEAVSALSELRAALSLPPDAAPEAGAARCRERMLEVPAAYCALEPGHVGRCEFYMGTTPAPAAAPEHLLGVQASTLRFSCGHTRSEHERISPTWIAGACPAAAPGTERAALMATAERVAGHGRCPVCHGRWWVYRTDSGSKSCPACHGRGK